MEATHKTKSVGTTLLAVETIKRNKDKFSKQDVRWVEVARQFQHTAGHMSDIDLMHMAKENTLLNCPITPQDVKLMKAILGPSVTVPRHIKDFYQDITICIRNHNIQTHTFWNRNGSHEDDITSNIAGVNRA